MARTSGSDDLFRLIHSLGSAEKRYFTKFAQRHTADGNKYLQLFNAINRQKEFEEVTLKKIFKAYPVMKVYLFEMIVKSLMVSSEGLEMPERMMLQMVGIRIIQQRGLYVRALREIQKLISTARQREVFFLEMELLLRALQAQNQPGNPLKQLQYSLKIFADIKYALNKTSNRTRYQEEASKIFAQQVYKSDNNTASTLEMDSTVDLPYLQDSKAALTVKNNIERLFALTMYYNLHQQFEEAYLIAVEWLHEVKKLAFTKPPGTGYGRYITALTFVLSLLLELGRFKEASLFLEKESNRKAPTEDDRETQLQQLSFLRTWLYWSSGKHMEGKKFLDKDLHQLTGYKDAAIRFNKYNQVFITFKILFEFSRGDYKNAFLLINEYESGHGQKQHSRFFKDCELLKILIQLELGHFALANTLAGNVLRKGRKLLLTPFNKQFLRALKETKYSNTKELFRKLHELFPCDEKEEGIFSALKIRDWIWSRHSGIPLAEVVSRQN